MHQSALKSFHVYSREMVTYLIIFSRHTVQVQEIQCDTFSAASLSHVLYVVTVYNCYHVTWDDLHRYVRKKKPVGQLHMDDSTTTGWLELITVQGWGELISSDCKIDQLTNCTTQPPCINISDQFYWQLQSDNFKMCNEHSAVYSHDSQLKMHHLFWQHVKHCLLH